MATSETDEAPRGGLGLRLVIFVLRNFPQTVSDALETLDAEKPVEQSEERHQQAEVEIVRYQASDGETNAKKSRRAAEATQDQIDGLYVESFDDEPFQRTHGNPLSKSLIS